MLSQQLIMLIITPKVRTDHFKQFVPMAVAKDIMSQYPTVYCEGLRLLLVYEDGVYKAGKEMFLRQKVQELLGYEANNQRVAEVIGQIERWRVLKVDAFN